MAVAAALALAVRQQRALRRRAATAAASARLRTHTRLRIIHPPKYSTHFHSDWAVMSPATMRRFAAHRSSALHSIRLTRPNATLRSVTPVAEELRFFPLGKTYIARAFAPLRSVGLAVVALHAPRIPMRLARTGVGRPNSRRPRERDHVRASNCAQLHRTHGQSGLPSADTRPPQSASLSVYARRTAQLLHPPFRASSLSGCG